MKRSFKKTASAPVIRRKKGPQRREENDKFIRIKDKKRIAIHQIFYLATSELKNSNTPFFTSLNQNKN